MYMYIYIYIHIYMRTRTRTQVLMSVTKRQKKIRESSVLPKHIIWWAEAHKKKRSSAKHARKKTQHCKAGAEKNAALQSRREKDLHTYIHYIHTYMHACTDACMHAYTCTAFHASFVNTCIRTYIHPYIHIRTHIYKYV